MALDPRISLAAQAPDVGAAVSQGLQNAAAIQQNKEQRATADIRQRILEQESQVQAIDLAQTRGQYMNQLATGLMNKPLDQRAAIVAQQMPFMQQMGINPADILSQDLTDQGLGAVVTQTQPFMQQTGGGSFQFGATQTVQKDDGSLVSVTQVRDPSSGGVRIVETPIEGQLVSSAGETAGQRKEREIETAAEKAQVVGDIETQQAVQEIEAVREAELTTAQELQNIATTAKRQERFSANQIERLDNAIETGLSAVSALPDINRGLELLQEINTGGLTARAKTVSDFFGTTSGEVGELNNILARNVLQGLSAFTGAISEGERQFIEKMNTSLAQGTGFNIAQLNRLRNIYQREIKNGLRASEIANDEFATGIFNDAMNAEASGFAAEVEQQQQSNIDFVNGL